MLSGGSDVRDNKTHLIENVKEDNKGVIIMTFFIFVASFKGGLNPPSGFWSDGSNPTVAGTSIFAAKFPNLFILYIFFVTGIFLYSFAQLILLLNFKTKSKSIDGLLNSMIVSLVLMLMAYVITIIAITPKDLYYSIMTVFGSHVGIFVFILFAYKNGN